MSAGNSSNVAVAALLAVAGVSFLLRRRSRHPAESKVEEGKPPVPALVAAPTLHRAATEADASGAGGGASTLDARSDAGVAAPGVDPASSTRSLFSVASSSQELPPKVVEPHTPRLSAGSLLSRGLASKTLVAVGLACIDNVVQVEAYPEEDSDVRCSSYRTVRGGNATNSLNIASQLGARSAWIGTLPDDGGADARFVLKTLQRDGIDFSGRVSCPGTAVPVSWITLSHEKGTRTILHYRDLPELTFDDFFAAFCDGATDNESVAAKLETVSWVHFEGRNVDVTRRIMARLRAARRFSRMDRGWQSTPTFSVELEKTHAGIAEKLVPLADVVFVAKEYALFHGHSNSQSVLKSLVPLAATGSVLVSPWGAEGATAVNLAEHARPDWGDYDTASLDFITSNAFEPRVVVDTTGAGDTFNAAFMCGLLDKLRPEGALLFACAVAGMKVGQLGMQGVVATHEAILTRVLKKARRL